MAGSRQRLRLLLPVGAVALAATGVLEAGCGGDDTNGGGGPGIDAGADTTQPFDGNPNPDGNIPPPDTNPPPDAGPPALGPATTPGDFSMIFDAVPDPTGATLYFTGINAAGDVGVFSVVPAASGPAASKVVSTTGFIAPIGIAISGDGKTLYVADVGNDEGNDSGGLYSLPVAGGAPTAIVKDFVPRGITVTTTGTTDTVYFTGVDQTTGQPGVYKVVANAPSAIATGAPFVDPSGVTVAANGDIFVSDTIASGDHHATIIKVAAGGSTATAFVSGLYVGYPVGIALVQDSSKVLLSGIDPATYHDAVTAYDVASMAATPFITTGLDSFSNAAGLHRAANASIFAWVDSAGDGTDAVHVVK